MVNSKRKRKRRLQPTAFLWALGAHCKRLREQRGYSIDRLSKETDHLSTSVIHRLETGSGPVGVTNIYRYAAALSIPLKVLFDFSVPHDQEFPPLSLLPPHSNAADAAAFRTHLPVYSLQAAAGRFGAGEAVESLGWIEVKGHGVLTKNMFVARAVGRSMEPKIHSGDLLVFRAAPEGTRQGKIVLAQYRGPADPETGGSFTVKVYSSTKSTERGGEALHKQVYLKPLNPEFQPIRLSPERAEDFHIVAEYLFTLS